ncbi:N-6 DNA methylase [Anoxybacteroides tepidamans]|uniref:N-6 DNA methylase n=1 Tax=Anoxybacteroides tepidamans TaxID=265948 RepID=UPI00054FA37F|nr:N-6 DNA methylase [Anoxybacillus tepidamans]
MSGEKLLWSFLDDLSGQVTNSEARKVSAWFLVLKYVDEQKEKFGLPHSCTISYILRSQGHVNEALIQAFQTIEEHIELLQGVFAPLDVLMRINGNTLLKFLWSLESVDVADLDWSLVMERLQWVGEEHETPSTINNLAIELLNLDNGSLYNGCLGIGSSFVAAADYARRQGIHLELFGQEMNREAWAFAKINLFLHGIHNAHIELGDSLLDPKFLAGNEIMKFDYVYMNVPFGMNINRHELLQYDPFNRFVYAPVSKSSSDSAFIQHALASLNENGRAVLIVTNGVLFRATEQIMRKNLLSADLIEAVIALPENLFGYTAIQTNVLIVNKNKPQERKQKVLFINAVNEYGEVRRKRLLTEENIEKIRDVYLNGAEIEKFSKFVEIADIEDGNLLCSKYLEDHEVETYEFGVVKISSKHLENLSNQKTLGEISKIYRGINVSPSQLEEGKGEFKLIKLSDVENGEVLVDEMTPANIRIQKSLDAYVVKEGDILISSRGTNIKIAIVPPHKGTLILSQNFHGIRLHKEMDPYFVKAYLESPVGQYLLARIQTGTSIKNINTKDLQEIPIPVPSIEEQKAIGEKYRHTYDRYQQALQKVEEDKKQSLLELYKQIGIYESMEIKRQ